MIEWVFSLTNGRMVLQLPHDLTKGDIEDVTRLLKLVLKQLPRFVMKRAPQSIEAVAIEPESLLGVSEKPAPPAKGE